MQTRQEESIIDEINELSDKGAILLNNKSPQEAKIYLDKALKIIKENNIENVFMIANVMFNKAILERELKNFDTAKNIADDLILKLKNSPSIIYVNVKCFRASLKADARQYDEAIEEYNECISLLNNAKETEFELSAQIYNNLAMVYSFKGLINKTLEYYKISLELYEEHPDHPKYKFFKADALNNIGILYQNLNEHKKALEYFFESLKNHDNKYYIAMAYNNISISYKELKQYNEAVLNREESVKIREEIYHQNPAYADNYADDLNNYGNLLNEIGKYDAAISKFLESLEIFSKLAKSFPEKYLEKIATTNANIAGSYFCVQNYEKAMSCSKQALAYFEKNLEINPIEYLSQLCGILTNLGFIYYETENLDEAKNCTAKIFEYLREIKALLLDCNNEDYLYAYKERVEKVTYLLIKLYSDDPDRLLNVIENKREENFIFDQNSKINDHPKVDGKEILLTIELSDTNCIFIVSGNKGNRAFFVENTEIISKCNALLKNAELITYNGEINDSVLEGLRKSGEEIFDLFPDEIKKYFYDDEYQIYLSPSENFVNFPFEFLVAKNEFIGLTHLLPRIGSYSAFVQTVKFEPEIDFKNKKLVILGFDEDIKGARAEYKMLSKKDEMEPFVKLSRSAATRDNITANIDDSLALFHFCGHGLEPDKLMINFGNEYIDSEFFSNCSFENNPLFFINCCLAGTTEYYGGGNFRGLPSGLFKAGAQAIISCTYPIYDTPSENFSANFYKNFLSGKSVGDSIMSARKEQKYPWEWGLHFLYGNPKLKISLD